MAREQRDQMIDMAAALWLAACELDEIMCCRESWRTRCGEYVRYLRRACAVGWPEDVAESAWHIVEDAMQHIADGRVPDEETTVAWRLKIMHCAMQLLAPHCEGQRGTTQE